MNDAIDVLVVEDDARLRSMLTAALGAEGFSVRGSHTLADAVMQLNRQAPDLVLLDLNLPDGLGMTLFEQWPRLVTLPVLVISARDDEAQKIELLDAGATDYLVKPFGVGELLARMRAALRARLAAASGTPEHYSVDGLTIDLERRRVEREGVPIHLTPREFAILACLARKAGRVVTHRQLLVEVWGAEFAEHTHYLRVYIGALRAKVERQPNEPRCVLTEVGVGYRLAER